jgi:ubiquinone biosynthesis protein
VISIAIPVAAQVNHQVPSPPDSHVLSYEKRLVLSYLLLGADESAETQAALVKRLQKTLKNYSLAPVREMKVTQFSEFLEAYKGPWPNSHSLASDLQLIEKGLLRGPIRFHAVDSQARVNLNLQREIDAFIRDQNQKIVKQNSSLLTQKLTEFAGSFSDLMIRQENPFDKPDLISKGFEQISKIYRQQTQVIDQIGKQVADSGQLNRMEPDIKLFIETVLQNYFSRMDASSKKHIVSQFLGLDLNATSMEKFEILLMSGGPQFQKLMQIVAGQSGLDPAFQKIIKKLESKVSPVPPVLVKELFEKERALYNWNSYELKPLGTGTMAQVHRGSIPTVHGPEDVVIRFLKPGIDKRVREDARILLEIATMMDADPRFRQAGLPKLLPVVQDLNKTITDELDMEATIKRQKMGREVYNKTVLFKGRNYKTDLKIHVPDVFQVHEKSNLMVQELVTGHKLEVEVETYKQSIPDLEKVIVENIGKLWIEEAVFKSGFFHSDLHQGNFMVEVQEPQIQLNLLDFGMGGILTKDAQSQLLLLVVGLTLDRADLVARGYWALSLKNENRISEADLLRRIETRVGEQKHSLKPKDDFNKWTSWAMDQGLRFPYEFVSLNRGFMILEQALKESGSTMNLTDLARKLAPQYARSIYMGWKSRNLLTSAELVRLGWESILQTNKNNNGVQPAQVLLSGRQQCSKVYSNHKMAGLFDFSLENLLQF